MGKDIYLKWKKRFFQSWNLEMMAGPKRRDLIGETIYLGRYPQADKGDISPIPWMILDVWGESGLLITKECLMVSAYCDMKKLEYDLKYLEWQNSLARERCKECFYQAFNEKEREIIQKRNIINEGSGSMCQDLVFLLSEKEVKTCFPDKESRKALLSGYAKEQRCAGGYSSRDQYADWWILPQYERRNGPVTSLSGIQYPYGFLYPKAVLTNGEIRFRERMAYYKYFAIRPCIQINLAAYQNIEAKSRKIAGRWRNQKNSPYGYELA